VAIVLESEVVSVKCCLQPRWRIDKKECVVDEMFLAEFRKKDLGYHLISRRRKLHVQQSGRVRIDWGVQPEPFIIQLDHGFVDRDVIRIFAIAGL
jgi:hypothetical protein